MQYTNPGGYPPLDHSSHVLADHGWDVLFLGTGAFGSNALELSPHERIVVKRQPFEPAGIRQKAAYLRYILWVVIWTLRWRPSWVYASDLFSCPVALLAHALTGVKVIYHEHDSPSGQPTRIIPRVCMRARRLLARRADLCVLPTARRAAIFARETGAPSVECVWNCPSKAEVGPPRGPARGESFTLLFHGSIVPARLPRAVVEALTLVPDTVRLRIVGYETVGSRGYVEELLALARDLGVAERVEALGALPDRDELLRLGAECDAGLALTPRESDDINLLSMVGASNKPFDYLARGLALLVTDSPEWVETYVAPGYGLAVDPSSAESIARALRWFLEHPDETREMGERGRRRIASDWSYEQVFEPVLRRLSGTDAASRSGHPPDLLSGR